MWTVRLSRVLITKMATSLLPHVIHVVLMSAEEKMIGTHTGWCVAGMENKQSLVEHAEVEHR